MSFFDIFKKKNFTTSVQKICEMVRPPIGAGAQYSDASSAEQFREWIYIAASTNARNVAEAEVKLYSKKKPKVSIGKSLNKYNKKEIKQYGFGLTEDTTEIISHPVIDLMMKPNDEDSAYSLLYKIQLFLELTGDAFLLIERNNAGIPTALYPLFSQYVNIQTDGLNKVIAYQYGVPRDGKFDYVYQPDDIIHFKNFDPNNILKGISPLQASARSNALINSQTTYEEALNRNLGVPSGVLKYDKQSIKSEDRELVEAKWQQKFASVSRAGKLLVTDKDISYQNIGINPRDMNWKEGKKDCRETILACFGINPAILLTENVNRSNMEQAEKNYYNQTIKPRLKLISQTLTNQLLNRNGISKGDLFLMIWKDAPTDSELLINEARLLSSVGGLTINEIRYTFGWDEVDGGDKLIKAEVMPSEK